MVKQKVEIDVSQAQSALDTFGKAQEKYNKKVDTANGLMLTFNARARASDKALLGLSDNAKLAAGAAGTLNKKLEALNTGGLVGITNLAYESRVTAGEVLKMGVAAQTASVSLQKVAAEGSLTGNALQRERDRMEVMNRTLSRLNSRFKDLIRTFDTKNAKLGLQERALRKEQTAMVGSINLTKSFSSAASRLGQILFNFGAYAGAFLFVSELRESISGAREFAKAISELQTISQSAALTNDTWAEGITKLSNAFGFDRLDVAEAAYQSLSNQVTQGAETFDFLRSQIGLALTTVSSLDEAVNASTAVINSFGYSVGQASEVSAILFKTVEEGRIRLGQLSNTIGRVAILSAQLGVTFIEQQAALTQLTKLGVKAEEAMTLLRNVQLRLLKPTERMKELFEEWGVSSGAAAVQTFGFTGVLAKFAQEASVSGDKVGELADLFKQLRSIVGITGLTQRDFSDEVGKFTKASEDNFKALEERINSLDTRANRQLESFRNALVEAFGAPVLKAIVSFTESLGGANNLLLGLAQTGRRVLAAFVAMKAAMLVFSANVAIAKLSTALLNKELTVAAVKSKVLRSALIATGIGAFAVVVGLAVDQLIQMKTGFQDSAIAAQKFGNEFQNAVAEKSTIALERLNIAIDESALIQIESGRAVKRTILQNLAEQRQAFTRYGDAANTVLEEIEDRLKINFVEGMKTARRNLKDAQQEVEELGNKIRKLTDDNLKKGFGLDVDQRLLNIENLDTDQQVNALNDLLLQVEKLGREKLEIDLDPEGAQLFFEEADRIIGVLQDKLTNIEPAKVPVNPLENDPRLNREQQRALARQRREQEAQAEAIAATKRQEAELKFEQQMIDFQKQRVNLIDQTIEKMKARKQQAESEAESLEKRFNDLQETLVRVQDSQLTDPDKFAEAREKFAKDSQGVISNDERLRILTDLAQKENALREKLAAEQAQGEVDAQRVLQDEIFALRDRAIRERQTLEKKANEQLFKDLESNLFRDRIGAEIANLEKSRAKALDVLQRTGGSPAQADKARFREAEKQLIATEKRLNLIQRLQNTPADIVNDPAALEQFKDVLASIGSFDRQLQASNEFREQFEDAAAAVERIDEVLNSFNGPNASLERLQAIAREVRAIYSDFGLEEISAEVNQSYNFQFGDINIETPERINARTAEQLIDFIRREVRAGRLKIN